MPKVSESEPASASAAVNEAIHTLSEAAQLPSAEARRIISTSNSMFGDAMASNRQFFRAWASGMESMLKASFEAQSSMLAVAPTLLETTFGASKTVVGTWPGVVKDYQKATLAAVHSTIESTEKLLTPPS